MIEDYKKIYEKYCSVGYFEINKRSFEKTVNEYNLIYGPFLPLNKNSKILDIGCGMGQFLSLLKNKGYKNFQGIDLSQGQVEPSSMIICSQLGYVCAKTLSMHLPMNSSWL